MRTLDLTWRRTADGVQQAIALEAALRERWSPLLAQARQRRFQRALADWEAERRTQRREHEARMSAWQGREAERRRELEVRLAAWETERAARREQLAARARRTVSPPELALWLMAALAALLVTGQAAWVLAAVLAAGLAAASPALASLARLGALRRRRPEAVPVQDPLPVLADPPPRPSIEREQPAGLDVVAPWWAAVAWRGQRHYDPGLPHRAHGDEGEQHFIDELARRLGDDHLVLRGPLVRPRLDADVVVIGATGIWVFEVKHWSGRIECRGGHWERTKSFYGPGGVPVTDTTPFSPDKQWRAERDAVAVTVSKRVRGAAELAASIGGGIVFSHPDVTLVVDDTRGSGYGTPAFWGEWLSTSPRLPACTPARVMEIADGLLAWHRRLDGDDGGATRCACELARRLAAGVEAAACSYCDDAPV